MASNFSAKVPEGIGTVIATGGFCGSVRLDGGMIGIELVIPLPVRAENLRPKRIRTMSLKLPTTNYLSFLIMAIRSWTAKEWLQIYQCARHGGSIVARWRTTSRSLYRRS